MLTLMEKTALCC